MWTRKDYMTPFLGANSLSSGLQNPSVFSLEIKYFENLKSSVCLAQFFSTSLIFWDSLKITRSENHKDSITQNQAFITQPAFRKPLQILVVGWHKVSSVIRVNPGGCPSCTEWTKVTLLVGGHNRRTPEWACCSPSSWYDLSLLLPRISHFHSCSLTGPTTLVPSASILKNWGRMREQIIGEG